MEAQYYEYPNPVDTGNAGIEIRPAQEMTGAELFLIRQAGLDSYAPPEAWTALGTNSQLSYSTHGIFRYYGKFPATVAAHLIRQYTEENDWVMDPMAGSGTTALEALLSNRNCRSYDINPLSVLLQKVKTTHIGRSLLARRLQDICGRYTPLTAERFDRRPVGIRDADHWFLPETQDSIRGLIFLINEIREEPIRNFFSVCLASSIRPVSRATTQQGRLFLDADTAKADCLDTFVKRAERAMDAVDALPVSRVHLEIGAHDAGSPYDFGAVNKLIIVHPPYFNSYKYSSVNALELSWMGVDRAEVRKSEVREFFKIGKPENVVHYVADMHRILNNVVSALAPGGVMGLMIGDTVIRGGYIRPAKMLLDRFLGDHPNIRAEKIVLRVPKYTEASWSASQRRKSDKVGIRLNDFIIVLRRNG